MLAQQKLTLLLAFAIVAVSASADSVYVLNGNNQFGTIDLGTGGFQQIGPNTPEGEAGLVPGPNGSLLTLTFSGNLDAINPVSGMTTVIGPTGLGDCATPPASPCGPTSANEIAGLGGTIYATDFANKLYTVDHSTGHATLIGPTGIPAVTFVPFTTNPDGTFDFFGEGLFPANGKLYAVFETGRFNPATGVATPVIPDKLYQINPATGATTVVAPTTFGVETVVNVNGTFYAFNNATSEIQTLDLANGNTTFVSGFDPAAGIIDGATATPEPLSVALATIGLLAVAVYRRRRRLA